MMLSKDVVAIRVLKKDLPRVWGEGLKKELIQRFFDSCETVIPDDYCLPTAEVIWSNAALVPSSPFTLDDMIKRRALICVDFWNAEGQSICETTSRDALAMRFAVTTKSMNDFQEKIQKDIISLKNDQATLHTAQTNLHTLHTNLKTEFDSNKEKKEKRLALLYQLLEMDA